MLVFCLYVNGFVDLKLNFKLTGWRKIYIIYKMLADATNFSALFQWVITHGYWLIFIALFMEGPVVTAAAAFAAALGYFNIYFIFLLSILGNLIPDIVLYAVGFWGRASIVDKYGHYFHISRERMDHLSELMRRHAWKTFIAVKLLPLIAVPGLMMAGAIKMPLRRYAFITTVIILPTSLIYLLLGYYFGAAYNQIKNYVDYAPYLIVVIMIAIFAISRIIKKLLAKFGEKVEKV